MKLRVIQAGVLRKRLLDVGFEEERAKDHVFYFYRHKGKLVVRTKVSDGAKGIGQPILGLIGKQLCLDRDEFERLLRGKLTAQEYTTILREKGVTD